MGSGTVGSWRGPLQQYHVMGPDLRPEFIPCPIRPLGKLRGLIFHTSPRPDLSSLLISVTGRCKPHRHVGIVGHKSRVFPLSIELTVPTTE